MGIQGRARHLLCVVVVCVLLAACASTGSVPVSSTLAGAASGSHGLAITRGPARPGPRARELLPWIESRVFTQANDARRRAGLLELDMRMDLMDLARIHAIDMARRNYFSHYSPDGDGPGDRARAFGLRYRAFAENLARVRNSPDPAALAVEGWLVSPGHRKNLLDEGEAGYRYTGIGVARGDDGAIYLSQLFLK